MVVAVNEEPKMSEELEPLGEVVDGEEVVDGVEVEQEDEEEEELSWEEAAIRAFADPRRTKNFSPNDAEIHLMTAKNMGHIFNWKRLSRRVQVVDGKPKSKPVQFLIETVPTRYDHYHNPEARGQIVLTTREVMAFVEGLYAGSRLRPERNERDLLTDRLVEGERWHPTNRAGDFFR